MTSFKSGADLRIALAAGKVCERCWHHKDEHIVMQGRLVASAEPSEFLLCPTASQFADLQANLEARASHLFPYRNPREQAGSPGGVVEVTVRPVITRNMSEPGDPQLAIAPKCNERDPFSPRICRLDKGHEGEHKDLQFNPRWVDADKGWP